MNDFIYNLSHKNRMRLLTALFWIVIITPALLIAGFLLMLINLIN